MDFEGTKTVHTRHTVLNIDRHYKISSAIRKVEKGKQFVLTFWKFCSAYGVNVCSVNLGRETTFLTLLDPQGFEFRQYNPTYVLFVLLQKKYFSICARASRTAI